MQLNFLREKEKKLRNVFNRKHLDIFLEIFYCYA